MKLWLLRHAPVVAEPGLCYGATDLAVHAEPTLAAAQAIAAQLPDGIALHCSPLQRCRALAAAVEVLRPAQGRFETDPRLAEMDFGQWETRPWSAIARSDIDAWMHDFADARAGGTGESTRQFMQRVGAAWDDWRASKRDALWVTHAGVIRAVWLLQQGIRVAERASDWPTQAVVLGSWQCIEVVDAPPAAADAGPQGRGPLTLR
ncbi:histidine phosphatase family protein [Variovorax sp. LT1R16]|uniref:histidine phosphatase family protein n=1 Tax=Variovorax sp. LT1R16 TaxID=3443728 RepID=UPI003F46467C